MKSDFFIDRPVFSTVLSVVIVIVGLLGLVMLPVDQYPRIVPPGGQDLGLLSGSQRPDRDAGRGDAHRAGAERNPRHALHGVDEQQLGRILRHRNLRHRHGRRPGGRRDSEPREGGRSAPPGRSHPERHLGPETGVEPADDHHAAVERPQVRRNIPLELRHAQRAGHAAPREGRRQRLERRQPLLRHADMGAARPAGQPRADGAGPAEGAQGPEPRIGGRRAGPAAHHGPRRHHPDHRPRPSFVGRGVRGDRRARQPRRIAHPPARRGARLARSLVVQHRERHQRRQRSRNEHQHAAGSQRHGGRARRPGDDGRNQPQLPGGNLLRNSVRHDLLHLTVDQGGLPHAVRSPTARDPRGLPLVAELARDADSDHRRADLADRNLRRDAGLRLLAQHDDPAGPDPGHRYRRGRRHRGRGGRGTHDGRRGAFALRGHEESHERTGQRHHRHVAGAVRRVRPRELPLGHHRPALPAVHHHDRRVGADFDLRGPDPLSGPLRPDPAPRHGTEEEPSVPPHQPLAGRRQQVLRKDDPRRRAPLETHAGAVRADVSGAVGAQQGRSPELHAPGGPGAISPSNSNFPKGPRSNARAA